MIISIIAGMVIAITALVCRANATTGRYATDTELHRRAGREERWMRKQGMLWDCHGCGQLCSPRYQPIGGGHTLVYCACGYQQLDTRSATRVSRAECRRLGRTLT